MTGDCSLRQCVTLDMEAWMTRRSPAPGRCPLTVGFTGKSDTGEFLARHGETDISRVARNAAVSSFLEAVVLDTERE